MVGMPGSCLDHLGEDLRLVALLVTRPEQQRHPLAMLLDVTEEIEQLAVARQLLPVAGLELRPAIDLVAVPLSQIRCCQKRR